MVNDKNHLYSHLDVDKDRKNINKRRTQQQFSRYSSAATNNITNAGLISTSPPLQPNTKPQVGNPYNDKTIPSIGLVTESVDFRVFGSEYCLYNLTGDVNFVFNGLPTGRHLIFTLDLQVDASNPTAITIGFPEVTNPPTLTGDPGDRYVLTFVGANVNDPTGVNAPIEIYTFISGTSTSGGVTYPIIWPKEDLTPGVLGTATINLAP
jgi:hypothetical protein